MRGLHAGAGRLTVAPPRPEDIPVPIENERKYPLCHWTRVQQALDGLAGCRRVALRQGYLNAETRIRCFTAQDGSAELVFSYKRAMPEGDAVEIETALSERDFSRLWPTCSSSLHKLRYKFAHGGLHWDVDFIQHGGATAFALAEVEMPERMDLPDSIPEVLQGFLCAPVPRLQGARYSSHSLCSPDIARSLARELGIGPDGACQD